MNAAVKYRCEALVSTGYSIGRHRCGKPAKHDPNAEGHPTRCGIHCDARVNAAKAKREADYALHSALIKAQSRVNRAEGAAIPTLTKLVEDEAFRGGKVTEKMQRLVGEVWVEIVAAREDLDRLKKAKENPQ